MPAIVTQEPTVVTARFLRYENKEHFERPDPPNSTIVHDVSDAVIESGGIVRFPVVIERIRRDQREQIVWVAWGEWGGINREPGHIPVFSSPTVLDFNLGGDMGSPWGYTPWLHTKGIHELRPVDPATLAAIACLYSEPTFAQAVQEATEHLAEIGPINEREWLGRSDGRRHGE